MIVKALIFSAIFALVGCASTGVKSSAATQSHTRTAQPLKAWKGGLEVLHAHAQAPRSDPLYASILVKADNAILRLGTEKDQWTAIVELRLVYRAPHYISLARLVDTGGYTEEVTVTIAPLSDGSAEVSYLRTVNNYKREDAHERRAFSIYAKGRLDSFKPTQAELGP